MKKTLLATLIGASTILSAGTYAQEGTGGAGAAGAASGSVVSAAVAAGAIVTSLAASIIANNRGKSVEINLSRTQYAQHVT